MFHVKHFNVEIQKYKWYNNQVRKNDQRKNEE